VAAHLEPEILLVDEVLAVGDAQFQKKCLGKMGSVAREGRTILFVSHSMAAVQLLCSRGIVLQAGELSYDGDVGKAIERYVQGGPMRKQVQDLSTLTSRDGTGEMRVTAFWLEDSAGEPASSVLNGKPCTFVIRCEVQDKQRTYDDVAATINVSTILGARVFYHHNLLTGQSFSGVSGKVEFRLHIPRLPLSRGSYFVDIGLSRDRGRTVVDLIQGVADFEVCDGGFFNGGSDYVGGLLGPVMVDGTWEFRQV
jgi:lipopolysaccharide transport system ATP-binding protein